MTGLGLMAMGSIETKKLLFKRAHQGDVLMLCGLPKVGVEIALPNDPQLICYEEVARWAQWRGTREIALCGSKGIEFECRELALLNGCGLQMSEAGLDVKKSCGPATCAVILVDKKYVHELPQMCAPINQVGILKNEQCKERGGHAI